MVAVNLNSVLKNDVNDFVWWFSVGGIILTELEEQLVKNESMSWLQVRLSTTTTMMFACWLVGTEVYFTTMH